MNRKRLPAIMILAWYFFFWGRGVAQKVGPFISLEDCNRARIEMTKGGGYPTVTSCWKT